MAILCSKKRVTIFAAYDKNCVIKKYVFTYLSYLKEISDYIIFISDCDYSAEYKAKLSGYVDYYECNKHGEYDFGSYKRGITFLFNNKLLSEYDELILCNDSCFCVASLTDMFEKMSLKNVDFWGMTQSIEKITHLQSFFLVFNKSVFLSRGFKEYFFNIKKKKDVWGIIYSYEFPLKKYFNDLGFKSGYFFFINKKINPCMHPTLLLENNCVLLKKKLFLEEDYSKDSVIALLFKLRKHFRTSISDFLELYNKNNFYFLILVLCTNRIKSFLYTEEISPNGEKRYKVFNIPILYILNKKNPDIYLHNRKICYSNYFSNLFKYNFLYFRTKLWRYYFIKNEEWGLSKKINTKSKISIYGFGPYGQEIFINLFKNNLITGIYDLNFREINKSIENPDSIDSNIFDQIIVTVMDKEARNSVVRFLQRKGISTEKIVFIVYKAGL